MYVTFNENHQPILVGASEGVVMKRCAIVFKEINGQLVVGSATARVVLEGHGARRHYTLPVR